MAVLREGGVSRAAVALRRSQPALSRRLEQLEADLGCALLDRSPAAGVLGPTEAGRALLPHAEAALAAARDARRAVEAVHRGGAGEIGLAADGTLATAAFAETLRRFAAAYPAARIALRTAASLEVSALIRRGGAALGLRYGAEVDPALAATPAGRKVLVAVAGRNWGGARPRGWRDRGAAWLALGRLPPSPRRRLLRRGARTPAPLGRARRWRRWTA